MLEVFDRFGAHLLSLKAMVGCYENTIIDLKEEGDSLQVNKVYDKYVAKADNISKLESLAILHYAKHIRKGFFINRGLFMLVFTQWDTQI